jgi:hypothetical protein
MVMMYASKYFDMFLTFLCLGHVLGSFTKFLTNTTGWNTDQIPAALGYFGTAFVIVLHKQCL